MFGITIRHRLVQATLIASTILRFLFGAAAEAQEARFIWDPPNPVAGQEIQFTDTSTGIPIAWERAFDNDGETDSYDSTTSHVFNDPGSYPVHGCSDLGRRGFLG